MFTPSKYQTAIFEHLATAKESATVIAVAGSGKTTTCLHGLEYLPDATTVKFFAFNTSIAGELRRRIQLLGEQTYRGYANVDARTFHSAGFGAVRQFLRHERVEVEDRKLFHICREWLNDLERRDYQDFIIRLVGLAKAHGIGTCLSPDTDDTWTSLIDHHDLDLDTKDADEARAVELAQQLLQRSNEAAEDGLIDFDDQLYLVALWELKMPQAGVVFIDEAQDTNPVRRHIAGLSVLPGGRVMAVGDEKQAIYGFTGASHDAMALITEKFSSIELPLTVSYRCPKAVVAQAKTIVPYIEAADEAPDGLVETLSAHNALARLGPADAILCRNTAPLVACAYALIARGVGCGIVGRDIGQGLVKLVQKQRADNLPTLERRLKEWEHYECQKFDARDKPHKAAMVRDKVRCLYTIIDHLPSVPTVPLLIARIEELFSDAVGGRLTLSTVHKAKGREWPKVAILRPDLMPSKWARQDWQLEQERNIQYVAWTRAQQELYFLKGEVEEP